jgi:multidrug resistance efflux pump
MTLESQNLDNIVAASSSPLPYHCVENVTATKRSEPGSSTSYFIKTPRNESLQFGPEEFFLWRSLDGQRSFDDIQTKFTQEFGVNISRPQFDDFLAELVRCGIVEPLAAPSDTAQPAAIVPPSAPVEGSALDTGPSLDQRRLAPKQRGFNPAPALLFLAWLGGPLRRFRWLLWPAAVAGVVGFGMQVPSVFQELRELSPVTGVALLVTGLIVTGLVPPLVQACVAAYYGVASKQCRIAFEPQLMRLRLHFDDDAYEALPARGITMTLAAPLLARLAVFAWGTLYWLAYHSAGDLMSSQALVIGQLSLISFLISSSPLFSTDGRKWLGSALGGLDLARRGRHRGPHFVIASWLWVLAVVAIGTLYATALLALVPAKFSAELCREIATDAVIVAAVAAVVARLWLRGVSQIRAMPRTAYRRIEPGRSQSPRALADAGAVVPLERDAVPAISPVYRPIATPELSFRAVIILAVIAALLESVAFVSYPYEAGGNFTTLPYDSSQLNARVPWPGGELTEVLVNEGDQIKPGQILGILSDWQQKYNLAVAKAQLETAEANLQNLLHSPIPENIELARQQYNAALARLPYDKAQFERYAALVTNDTVSKANYDQVLSQYQQDQAAAEVARANYDTVRSGPTPDQIEAARGLVRQNTATVVYDEDELERTRIRATSFGAVVTPNPMLLRGKWFAAGGLVFTVEDHRMIQADVQVPETDIDNVRIGGSVRLRLWGSPEKTFIGRSVAIAPVAQTSHSAASVDPQSSSSNVIRVRTEVPNPDGLIHANTDGYAKLDGYHMPTWRAFGLMIERFLFVQIWSWIP